MGAHTEALEAARLLRGREGDHDRDPPSVPASSGRPRPCAEDYDCPQCGAILCTLTGPHDVTGPHGCSLCAAGAALAEAGLPDNGSTRSEGFLERLRLQSAIHIAHVSLGEEDAAQPLAEAQEAARAEAQAPTSRVCASGPGRGARKAWTP